VDYGYDGEDREQNEKEEYLFCGTVAQHAPQLILMPVLSDIFLLGRPTSMSDWFRAYLPDCRNIERTRSLA
jgi:hypothetical protein